ncbi:MAG: c-type cytochrome [Chloroflexi bacterium]|nr:c-type cytochrome [Chloroflexota bacterium]
MRKLSRPRRIISRLIIINLALLLASAVWYWAAPTESGVAVAIAKTKHMLDMNLMAEISFTPEMVQEATLANPEMAVIMADKTTQFVNAVPLSLGEARPWQDAGCSHNNCAHVTYYNYSDGGTINSVVNLQTNQVVGGWLDAAARPSGSTHIMDKAMAIAAADKTVQTTLGDIGAADPAMVPMSGWLVDDACRDDWCVDLSFHDPEGNGRILHVFVNMEQDKVARLFYTRGRAARSAAAALPQQQPYKDGCREQYGWNVCWEMTAHDGINFRDATYQDTLIFSSVKIGQVEAWYPSWPGGYRDEVGFAASVPPYGGTHVNDLGDGFEVTQLFTEFTYWPNCICCYRYEEILRFFDDGSFELSFVSHGPGCDDLSIYRPFWRIDLDLNGRANDNVWVWQENQWVEVAAEMELHPFIADLSPDGKKLATIDGDHSYRWHMPLTDPLGLDENRFFILQKKAGEGDGPIVTGPGDTFQPPRQWIDGDPVFGQDVVFWYVPLLKSKKGGPWWCAPDPEPDFSPCDASLRVETAGELVQPTIEEITEAEAQATPTVPPSADVLPSPTPAPTSTPRPIEGENIEELLLNAGCGACHLIGNFGAAHKVGPDLSAIGVLAETRVAGMSAADYLLESIVDPNAYIVPDCPNAPCIANVMPRDYTTRLSPEQIEAIVAYMLTLTKATPTTIGAEGKGQLTPAPKAIPAPKMIGDRPQKDTALLAVQILLITLVFLLTVFLLYKQPAPK